ncbi:O-acyltransferase WSD1 isoform X2 [Capsella rubella]|nr:O-acyltransferase WSD1 isoform X2 [Capsella rubella]
MPLDRSRPLWDIHILNVKTTDAEAVGVLRFNHALADGMSFFSLVLACTHKTSNPDVLSTSNPSVKRRTTMPHNVEKTGWFPRTMFTIGSTMRLIWNTFVDLLLLSATMLFLKDTKTPLTGGVDVRTNPKRFYHRNISLDDVKLIKNAMNMTINDVLLGITQAALSSYMNRRYEQDKKNEKDGALLTPFPNNLPDGIRFRAGCTVNLRSDIGFKPLAEMMAKDSKCKWGNYFSFIILPLSIGLETDPLVYLKKAKAMMARKKHSYHAPLVYFFIKIILKVFGAKAAASVFNQYVMNITTCVSNVMGPMEEVSFHGHPIAYISPSSYGHSQALLVHYTSYAGEMTITMMVDPTVIPDPHKICDDMEESLKTIKAALWERGLL